MIHHKIYTSIFCLLLSSFFTNTANAQKQKHDCAHEHHKNEIGVANSPVYFIKEKSLNYGLHMHYIRQLNNPKFGVGLGYERIFDDHAHSTYGLVGVYRPVEALSINLSPGFTLEKGENTARFAFHAESSYEFEIKNFHIGPAFEFAYDPEDYHISLGLHIGLGF